MRKKIYSGRIIDLYRYDIKLEGRKVRRDIIVHPGASAIVAFDSDGKIILVKQNRFPHGRVLEIPAGTLEKGEILCSVLDDSCLRKQDTLQDV